jgi:3D (Asp-Asp-Asp) domain-containing protein
MRSYIIAIVVALACFGCAFAAVSDGQQADIQAATEAAGLPQVTVLVDGGVIGLSTSAATVDELLGSLGVQLDPLDRTTPALDQPVADGLEVRVTRVACRKVVEEGALPSRTVVLADPEMPAGYTKILAHGTDGLVRRVWRVWEKDGVETSRGVVSEAVLQKATETVVLRGTYGAPTRGGNWRRPLIMTATAYDPGPRSCGKYADGRTATGAKAEKGVVAVDDRVIPMGSRLYIPGYGFAVAADRGSAIKGKRIDLCYATYWEARQFGRKKIKVYLLD